jgi:hypothetical protein
VLEDGTSEGRRFADIGINPRVFCSHSGIGVGRELGKQLILSKPVRDRDVSSGMTATLVYRLSPDSSLASDY